MLIIGRVQQANYRLVFTTTHYWALGWWCWELAACSPSYSECDGIDSKSGKCKCVPIAKR